MGEIERDLPQAKIKFLYTDHKKHKGYSFILAKTARVEAVIEDSDLT